MIHTSASFHYEDYNVDVKVDHLDHEPANVITSTNTLDIGGVTIFCTDAQLMEIAGEIDIILALRRDHLPNSPEKTKCDTSHFSVNVHWESCPDEHIKSYIGANYVCLKFGEVNIWLDRSQFEQVKAACINHLVDVRRPKESTPQADVEPEQEQEFVPTTDAEAVNAAYTAYEDTNMTAAPEDVNFKPH
jgi:hypothetical protein